MKENMEDFWNSLEIQSLKEIEMSNIWQMYESVEHLSKRILYQYYGEKYTFPINIRGIVKMFGLGIFETNLNVDLGFRLEKVNGYLHKKYDKGYCINLNVKEAELNKRYFLAHVLSRYVLAHANNTPQEEIEKMCGVNYADPLFTKNNAEIIADILSALILFPPECVLDSFAKFANIMKERQQYPIDFSKWIHYLSQEAQIASYYTLPCYQHIKIYLSCLCNSKSDSKLISKYRQFFK